MPLVYSFSCGGHGALKKFGGKIRISVKTFDSRELKDSLPEGNLGIPLQ